MRRKGAAWTGFHSSVVEARNSGAPAHLQLKRITSILPRAREKQRRESVRREGYDSNQASKHIDATSEPGSRDPRWFEGSQLEEEEACGRKKKQESKKRTSYREYEEDA